MSGFYVYICWDADRRPLYVGQLRPIENVRHNPRRLSVGEAIEREEWHNEYLRLNGHFFAGMPLSKWRALTEEQRGAYYLRWDLEDPIRDARAPGGATVVSHAALLSGVDRGDAGTTPAGVSSVSGVAS